MSRRFSLFFISIAFLLSLNGCAENKTVLKDKSLIHMRLGVSYFREGDTTSALRELLEAEKLNPNDPQVCNVLGLIYLKKKDYEKAISYFNTALEVKPDFSEVRNNLGALYLELRQWDNAIFEFKRALSDDLYRTPERAYSNIGWAYYKKGDIGKAIDNYKKALDISPDFVLARYNLGISYLSINKVDKAINALKMAIKQNPDYFDAHYQLGLIYFNLNKREEAKREFDKVISTAPPGETRDSAQTYLDLLK